VSVRRVTISTAIIAVAVGVAACDGSARVVRVPRQPVRPQLMLLKLGSQKVRLRPVLLSQGSIDPSCKRPTSRKIGHGITTSACVAYTTINPSPHSCSASSNVTVSRPTHVLLNTSVTGHALYVLKYARAGADSQLRRSSHFAAAIRAFQKGRLVRFTIAPGEVFSILLSYSAPYVDPAKTPPRRLKSEYLVVASYTLCVK
jgi:hypothetical protein